jgi:hypothetical protein
MKAIAVLTFMFVLCTSWASNDTVVPLHDKSLAESPLENLGAITVSQSESNGTQAMSHTDRWDVVNHSSKPIVAIVETATIQYANGHSAEETVQYDAFFHTDLLGPGAHLDLSSGMSGQHVAPTKSSTLAIPSCEVVARWVQFSDGTMFGDAKYATQLLEDRKSMLSALMRLERALLSGGLDQFAQELQRKDPSAVADAYLGHLRHVEMHDGVQAATESLQTHLRMARQRSALLGGTGDPANAPPM